MRAVLQIKADNAVVRGTSPFPSMVPEDRSRFGDVDTLRVVFTIPFRRVLYRLIFRCGSAKYILRRV